MYLKQNELFMLQQVAIYVMPIYENINNFFRTAFIFSISQTKVNEFKELAYPVE